MTFCITYVSKCENYFILFKLKKYLCKVKDILQHTEAFFLYYFIIKYPRSHFILKYLSVYYVHSKNKAPCINFQLFFFFFFFLHCCVLCLCCVDKGAIWKFNNNNNNRQLVFIQLEKSGLLLYFNCSVIFQMFKTFFCFVLFIFSSCAFCHFSQVSEVQYNI